MSRKFTCDLARWFTKGTIINKNTSSPTDVIFADLIEGKSRTPVSIKLWMDIGKINPKIKRKLWKYVKEIYGLQYELKVYKDIITKIVKHSPNFVKYVGSAECPLDRVQQYFGPQILRTIHILYEEIYDFKENDYKHTSMDLLVTEKAGSEKNVDNVRALIDVWYRLNENDQQMVMFQIVYAIAVMQKYRLIHNDLHAGNILVVTYKNKKTRFFEYRGKIYNVVTKYIPLLFDWDRSYCEFLGQNRILDGDPCLNWGTCNRFTPKFDLYVLCCTLGFQGDIPKLYNNYVSHYMETKEEIPLSPEEQKRLLEQPTYADEFKYKLSSRQLEYIFGDNAETLSKFRGAVSTTVTLEPHDNTIRIFAGWDCRPSTILPSQPSPEDLLRTKFNDLLVPSVPRGRRLYTFPKHVEYKAKLYIDPYINTRRKIAGKPQRILATFMYMDPQEYSVMKNLEMNSVIGEDYVITDGVRNKYINIIFKMCIHHKNKMVLFLAITLFDVYLYNHYTANPLEIHNICLACIIRALDYYNMCENNLDEFLTMYIKETDEKETENMDIGLVNDRVESVKHFFQKRYCPTPLSFFDVFNAKLSDFRKMSQQTFITNLITLSLSKKYSMIKPSSTAIGIMVSKGSWNDVLAKMTKYQPAKLPQIEYVPPAYINPNYMDDQKYITPVIRRIVVDWLVETSSKYSLHLKTFLQAIHIVDSYLSQETVEKKNIQLLGITALLISSILNNDNDKFSVDNAVYICDGAYSRKHVENMQSKINNVLGKSISQYDNPLNYMNYKTGVMTYLLNVSACMYNMLKYSPREIGMAVNEIYKEYPRGTVHLEASKELLQTLRKNKRNYKGVNRVFPDMITMFDNIHIGK